MTLDAAERRALERLVDTALAEDLGPGDLTAGLVPAGAKMRAAVVVRDAAAVLCGAAWFDAVFGRLNPAIVVDWQVQDGAALTAGQRVCTVEGPARDLLSGERAALNLLQTLSGTATRTARYVEAVAGTGTVILDTRKTIPGLRLAQKYAVRCGGGRNHRIGLFDAILIKENHIRSAGSIEAALAAARATDPAIQVEIEVETLVELSQALEAGASRVLLDNFDLDGLREAVRLAAGRADLEASGGITLDRVRAIAETGVQFISVGALTKHVAATDYSMLFEFD